MGCGCNQEESGEEMITEPGKIRGLGDLVAKITKFFGVKPCSACKKRQKWLNEKFPFKYSSAVKK